MLKLTLITLGNKMPFWVNQGAQEYIKRLQDNVLLKIIEIPLLRRGKLPDIARIMEKEMHLMQAAVPQGSRVIALDITGESFTSEQLAGKLERLQHINSHLCFLVGGPEGLSPELVARCDERWSLSKLTLPHPLVRIVFLEALYRACSILNNHPYHK